MVTLKGGDKFALALADIAKNVQKAASVNVGFLGDVTEEDGTNTAMIAAIQEFGAPSKGIPPRPFFRNMIAAKSPEWPAAIGDLLIANGYDAAKTLGQTGEEIAKQLQVSISEISEPPLSPVTVMLRGMRRQARYKDKPFWELFAEAKSRVEAGQTNYGASEKPLVDTGTLLGAVHYEVKS